MSILSREETTAGMDAESTEPAALPPPVLFGRPGKKRKMYRQRRETTTDDTVADGEAGRGGNSTPGEGGAAATPAAPRPADATTDSQVPARRDSPRRGSEGDAAADAAAARSAGRHSDDSSRNDGDDDGDDNNSLVPAVSALVRRRKPRRPRLGGVGFRGDGHGPSKADGEDHDGDGFDADLPSGPIPIDMRFTAQTGLIGELVNKHMEEYVEAQMAKRYNGEASQSGARGGDSRRVAGSSAGSSAAAAAAATSDEVREQLAMKGKLHEIDLGAEARARNIAMTEQATRKLRGQDDGDAAGGDGGDALDKAGGRPGSPPAKKPRLGRNGKPLKPHRRRGSDDIKRDQMVEQFLHENRMDVDVYDKTEPAPSTEGRPTDDRVAEQFRRDFMEAVAQRLRRKRRPLGPPAKPKTRNEEEILRGPKLGGSRNVRSVMRDKLLQKQEEERQNIPKYEQELQEQRRRANRRR